MKTLVAVACAAGAVLATTSFANAQECRGGYRTLPNQVIVRCDDGPYYYREEAPAPYYGGPVYAPAPRVYVERPYYYERYPAYYERYPAYYYDRPYPYSYRWHHAYRDNCWPFRALSAVIPGVAPPAC